MLNKYCTEPYLVRYIEATYIFLGVKTLKEFSSLEQYQYAEGFQRLQTGVKLRCVAFLQILSFEYLHYDM